MSDEKKGESCAQGKGCCGAKKLVFTVLLAILVFIAGMLFGKSSYFTRGFCPLSGPVHK